MIYLVRHGETEWNRLRLLQGQTDIPLSEEGAEEIRRQAMRLKEIGFQVDHIVTSPLKRAAQTAQILADIIGYTGQIQVNDDLKERCFGKAEGLSLAKPLDVNDPAYEAEPMESLQLRIRRALESCDPMEDWLLVTHGGLTKACLGMLSKASGTENYSFLPRHGNPIALLDAEGKFVGKYILEE